MTNTEIQALFGYMRGIWGKRFTQVDTDMRAWHDSLYAAPFFLVKQAVDKFDENSPDGFPPSRGQLKAIINTLQRNTRLEVVPSPPQIEYKTSWQQWAVYKTEQLLFMFEWSPRPKEPYTGTESIGQLTNARQATPEFKAITAKILAKIPDYFADYKTANSCPTDERDAGIKKIFHDIGAINPRNITAEMKILVDT